MGKLTAYHVVTDRPMAAGQRIVFDGHNKSGVYRRVMEKRAAVAEIYAHPECFRAEELEHHTAVALRELALEEVRQAEYPDYPSRLGCLYVSNALADARKWAECFVNWGRPTHHIVKLEIDGSLFEGDANNCFDAATDHQQNLALAQRYWQNALNLAGAPRITEILAAGTISVLEIVEEINKNL